MSKRRVYWWRPLPDEPRAEAPRHFPVAPPYGRRNFGDELTPLLVEELWGGDYAQAFSIEDCDLLGCGSHLDLAYRSTTGKKVKIDVWGAGFIAEHDRVRFNDRFKFHLVRGWGSKVKVGREGQRIPVGDPGLIFDRVHNPLVDKKWELGVVPHYIDQEANSTDRLDPIVDKFSTVKWINVWDDPHTVAEQIKSCERIISSSLHGLVLADCFKVPNVWCQIGFQLAGGQFKFWDYYTAFFGPNLTKSEQNPDWLHTTFESDFDEFDRAWDTYNRPRFGNVQADIGGSFPWT